MIPHLSGHEGDNKDNTNKAPEVGRINKVHGFTFEIEHTENKHDQKEDNQRTSIVGWAHYSNLKKIPIDLAFLINIYTTGIM